VLNDSLPIFLDTNVIQALATFGEYVYDGNLAPELNRKLFQLGKRYRADVDALAELVPLLQRNGWPIVVSPVTLLEHRDYDRLDWDLALFDYFLSTATARQLRVLDVRMDSAQTALALDRQAPSDLDFLPDANDRALIDDAITFGCHWFLTLDYRTIWRFRNRIAHLGLVVVTPTEAAAAFFNRSPRSNDRLPDPSGKFFRAG
jgi:hypothetical protein